MPAAFYTLRLSFWKYEGASSAVVLPLQKKNLGLPFLIFRSSSPSQVGVMLLMNIPVFCRSVTTRNVPPSRRNSSFDKQTASTRDSPDHRCNCISALIRALFVSVIFVSSILDRIFSYSFGSRARTFWSLNLTLTLFQCSGTAGLVAIMLFAKQYLKKFLTFSCRERRACGAFSVHSLCHIARWARVT